jgi:hypothetical protein
MSSESELIWPKKQAEMVAVTGEVIFESVHHPIDKKSLKHSIRQALERRIAEEKEEIIWASYLVIFSPGQEYEEVRCQVDVETDGARSAFSVGYGQRPNHAFDDAMERLQWFEKSQQRRIV